MSLIIISPQEIAINAWPACDLQKAPAQWPNGLLTLLARPHRMHSVHNEACCNRWFRDVVCQPVSVRCAKTAERAEVTFGVESSRSSRHVVSDWSFDSQRVSGELFAIFSVKHKIIVRFRCGLRQSTLASCQYWHWLWFRKQLHGDNADDDAVNRDVTLEWRHRRLVACMHRCQSASFHSSCVARCTARTASLPRLALDVNSPSFSPGSTWQTGRLADCRTNISPLCAAAAGTVPPRALVWPAAHNWHTSDQVSVSETGRATSKRGYNDIVDLCIAYNCPQVMPGSIDFMRCIRHFHCM